MKVSEVIDQLEVGDTVWVKSKVTAINFEGGYIRSENTKTSIYLDGDAEISLTEPQAEKVEVSQEFAEWLETALTGNYDKAWCVKEIAGYGWGSYMHDPATGKDLTACEQSWVATVQRNKEKHIKAIYDGYTVKPKRWVVKFNDAETDFYFMGWSDIYKTDDNPFVPNGYAEKDKDRVFMFDDHAKAEAVATLVEGSVEEV